MIPLYRRIRFKLTAAFIALVMLALVLSSLISFRAAERQFESLLFQEFRSTKNTTDNFLAFVEQTALITARSVSSDTELQDLLTSGVPKDQLANRLHMLKGKHTADALILIDHEGRIAARGNSIGNAGDFLTYFGVVRNTIATGEPCTAIVQDMESFVLYASSPVNLSEDETGARFVLAGYELNNDFVDHVQKNSQIGISLIRERSIIATTLRSHGERITTIPIPYLEYQTLLANSDHIIETELLGQRHFVTAARMPGMQENMAGSILLVHSTEELDVIKKTLAFQLCIIFLGCLGFISVLVYFSSASVLQPIEKLTEGAEKISSGEFTSHIQINANDEFGELAANFNRMVDTIREKDEELRTYGRGLEVQVAARTTEIEQQTVLIDNILRSSHELGIAATNLKMEITYFNPAAARILGFNAQDIIGKTVHEIHAGHNIDPARIQHIVNSVKTEGFASFEITRKINEQIQNIDVLISAMHDKKGMLKGFVFMVRDLTERKKMAQRIQEGQKFEAFTILAGGLAHDLNNLLQLILGHVSLAQDRAPAESDLAKDLSIAEDSIEQASQLGRRLLVLSQSDLGQEKCPMDVSPILKEEIERVSSGDVHCEFSSDENLWMINGNEEHLREAFRCFIENALEAMDYRGHLMITAQNRSALSGPDEPLAGSDRLRIDFSDAGRGIPKEHIASIFDPYFSTKALGVQKGMGLSLATARAVITKHQGEIRVKTEAGVGSTFSVWLPADRS